MARAIVARTLKAEDVPVLDRALVQECLLFWWLKKRDQERPPE